MGDLVLTCTGPLSRNRAVGEALGRGKSLDEILHDMNMVAEGVKTTLAARTLANRLGVEMPITEQVYQVLYDRQGSQDGRRRTDDPANSRTRSGNSLRPAQAPSASIGRDLHTNARGTDRRTACRDVDTISHGARVTRGYS